MGKFTLILILIYVLYYAGNIVYDLYFKKETTVKTEETEVFSLEEFADEISENVTKIGIDDVEDLNTPDSFSRVEKNFEIPENPQPDLEELRKRFDEESTTESDASHIDKTSVPKSSDAIVRKTQKELINMLNLAESSVQVVGQQDGYLAYKMTF